jgi:Mn2+/Fe2+ NRAMP family transporter
VAFPISRKGSAADRGKLIGWPPHLQPAAANAPGGIWRSIWNLGPGLITGAADLDPSAVITATVAGAAYAFSLLWVVVLCVPFLLTIFSVTARIGIETRRGLLDLVRDHYGRNWAMAGALLTIVTNMAVIVADLMAVTEGLSIVLNQPRMFFVAVTAFSVWYILIFRDYRKITRALVVLSLPLYLYVAAAVMTAPGIRHLLWSTFVPHVQLTAGYVENIVALFGSLLTPYILLWQVSSRSDPTHEPSRGDAHAATLVSTLLAFSIMVAAGSVLHLNHAVDMTTRQAAEALRPAVGDWGTMLFAVGIIGAGLVALPVLVASMCYDLAQAMGWKYGLSEHPWDAKRFYALISGAMFFAGVANFFRINPVKALYWSMILAGLLTIPTLIFILVVSNDRRIMRTVNSRWQNFWIGAATGGMFAVGLLFAWWKLL